MKKQANKKLTFSTETLRQLTSDDDLGVVVGGGTALTTAITCTCTTTAVICSPSQRVCTTAINCG